MAAFSAKSDRVKTVRDVDANALFENHSVAEVRDIEKKIRHDIEWKKEEMRDLVGERYRDLISAADTIKQMKLCAEKVSEKLTSINTQCSKLKEIRSAKSSAAVNIPPPTRTNQKAVYEIACEIKFLLAVPGKIWSYLDNSDYLPAAKLYLLSKHVHNCLLYDTQTGGQVFGRFPVIAKQWSAISHFKSSIVQGCRRTLSDYTESNANIANAVCSILLLEEKTPRQVFQDFLVCRVYSGKGVTGARNHLSNAIQLIHSTVYQLTSIFARTQLPVLGQSNLLADTLSVLLQQPLLDQLGITEFSSLRKHLPKSVTDFLPTLRVQNVSLSEEYLKSSCDKWLQTCLDNVRSTMKEQMSYVTTIKSMTSLKDTVWTLYTQDKRMKCWSEVCSQLFSRPVNLWLDELSPLFSSRVKEIIAEHFHSILSATSNQLDKSKELMLSDPHMNSDTLRSSLNKEVDMSSFIWCESANDLPAADAWVSSAHKTFEEGGGLLMKANGFTPIVQSLCSRLNQSLVSLMAEVEAYRLPQEVDKDVSLLLSNQEEISAATAEVISREAHEAICSLSNLVAQEIEAVSIPDDSSFSSKHCSWVLLLARFTAAVPKLCPHLEKCVLLQSTTSQTDQSSRSRSMAMSMSRSFSKSVSIDPLWSRACETLAQTSASCYRIWCKNTVESISEVFRESLSVDDVTSLLNNVTRWDEIEIEEDAEDGKTIKSLISVPMQTTWCLQNCFNLLCNGVNKVGSHSIPRSLQTELVSSVLLQILSVYKSNLQDTSGHVTQAVALQYLFDVWYLSSTLLWRESDKAAEIESLCSSLTKDLQARVDPFDLDVFTPYMQRHCSRQRSRSAVLFGAIADSEKLLSTATRQPQTGRAEQHNVLPLYTTVAARFPLLPVISETSRVSAQTAASKRPPAASAVAASLTSSKADSSGITKAQSEPFMKMSSSFYDRIGSGAMSWFTRGSNANN